MDIKWHKQKPIGFYMWSERCIRRAEHNQGTNSKHVNKFSLQDKNESKVNSKVSSTTWERTKWSKKNSKWKTSRTSNLPSHVFFPVWLVKIKQRTCLQMSTADLSESLYFVFLARINRRPIDSHQLVSRNLCALSHLSMRSREVTSFQVLQGALLRLSL